MFTGQIYLALAQEIKHSTHRDCNDIFTKRCFIDGSQNVSSSGYTIPQAGATGTHSVAADSNLFVVPYNKGFNEIDDTSLSWVSDYPELVHIIFSFQYIRSGNADYMRQNATSPFGADWGDAKWAKIRKNRLQVAINVDGVNLHSPVTSH